MQKQKSQPIATDQFLTEEYEYIAQTAAQANEDRARVSSFYLIAVGSLIAAIFGTQFFDADFFTRGVKFIFSGIFLLLTLMGIVITHRIVGPVYKLKRLLRRVSTGRIVVDEHLRRGDELEDLFETFLQMTHSLSAIQHARVATLDATLRRAEATDAAPEVLDGLKALRAQMTLGLEPRRRTTVPPPPVA